MSDDDRKSQTKTTDKISFEPSFVIEHLGQELVDILVSSESLHDEKSDLVQLLIAVYGALRNRDRSKTRVIITGNLISSVNTRREQTDEEFTLERGAGIVAAKTMPSNTDGVVDILIPAYWVLPLEDTQSLDERSLYVQHLAAHEAVHASIMHIGNEPFNLHKREEFEGAMAQFVYMAGAQIEEHLAEFIGSKTTGRKLEQNANQVSASIEAWHETIFTKLPAIPRTSPDYFYRGMKVTFESFLVLWKSLAYLAAALRTNNQFDTAPPEITDLPEWNDLINPWWPQYLELLRKIPMTTEVDIQVTDKIIQELASYLQSWASDIGFDYHDTKQGPFFRVKS